MDSTRRFECLICGCLCPGGIILEHSLRKHAECSLENGVLYHTIKIPSVKELKGGRKLRSNCMIEKSTQTIPEPNSRPGARIRYEVFNPPDCSDNAGYEEFLASLPTDIDNDCDGNPISDNISECNKRDYSVISLDSEVLSDIDLQSFVQKRRIAKIEEIHETK